MIKEIIATGKDVSEAQENARAALGAGPLDEVNFEVVELGSRGIFGLIGVKPAKVKASMEIPDAPERRPERPRREQKPEGERKPQEARREHSDRPERKRPAEQKPKAQKPAQSKKPREKVEPKADKPKQEKPKSAVIPEKDLVMEKKEVAPGQDVSFDFIRTLLADVGLSAEATLYTCNDGTRRINISGSDASVLIGHHGDTLDALQYLANLASAQKNEAGERDKTRVTIDIEGYRAKREETLRALARRMAAKALRNKRSVMLEPMSAYERRIIHSEVQGIEGVSTNSIGAENNRKIVIYLTDKKPEGIFEEEEETVTPLQEEFRSEGDVSPVDVLAQSALSDAAEGDAQAEVVSIEKIEEESAE